MRFTLKNKFQNEYLTELRERQKNINRSAKREIKAGELILVMKIYNVIGGE